MPSGGHARSGPPVDPRSGRSDRRGVEFDTLPASGFEGPVPDFPLPRPVKRELVLWEWAWRTPQAAAWSRETWRWHAVAMWARTAALAEERDSSGKDKELVRKYADDIGLSAAGLRYNGWAIAPAPDQVDVSVERVPSSRERFEVIDGGA